MDQAQNLRNKINSQKKQHNVARVITVTSGKGGVGKTSISVNLAIWLQRFGKRVIMMDADFGLANIEIMLGIRPQYNLADLMFHKKNLKEIITKGPEGIGFISGGSGIQEMTNLTKEQIIMLSKHLYELDELADVIIIDTGAGISDAVLEFVTASNEVVLVGTPEPTSITDAYALLKTLNKRPNFYAENTTIKMIANRVSNEKDGVELFDKLNVVASNFLNISIELLGVIPQDNNVSKAVMVQKPFSMSYPNSSATKAIHDIAVKLCDDPTIEIKDKKGIAGMFANLMRQKLNV